MSYNLRSREISGELGVSYSPRHFSPFNLKSRIASEKSVRTLAGHINGLTKQQNEIAKARHGGDLSSYINQVDDKLDNMIKGIKENNMITKVLQAQITNEGRHLKTTFTKMVSLYGQQIEQSYTVERHFATLVSSIATLLNGKISPLLISPKEITDIMNYVQNHLIS